MNSITNVSRIDVSIVDVSSIDVLSGDVLSGDVSSIDVLSGDVSGGDVSSIDVSSIDVLSGDVSGVDVLSGDVLSGDVSGVYDIKEPHTIFIIPYRNRLKDLNRFLLKFNEIKKAKNWDNTDVELYFSHQKDNRLFNRGAVKNIGFLAMKQKYSNTYQDKTFIFHDVDTVPITGDLLPYATSLGIVSHYYGYEMTLGGIFAIKGKDFERTGGFPNFWGWGFEDNCIYDRCIKNGLIINRNIFYKIQDKEIIQNLYSIKRKMSKREMNIYKYETPDTINDLKDIKYNINYVYSFDFYMIDISNFTVLRQIHTDEFYDYDLRNGSKVQIPRGWFRRKWSLHL